LSSRFKARLDQLVGEAPAGILSGGQKGIEKESLRVRQDGNLATSPHPAALGSALTNRFITTDFSEALLEFVTPAFPHTWEALRVLCEIHQFTYERLGDELLWVTSMPCVVGDDESIPLAQYGDSNVGRMKTVYRNGLGYRYGRAMQTIAGVHFNYSLPEAFWPVYHELTGPPETLDEFRSAAYMGLVRNFRRMGWLILYLFGASPALCKSFLGKQETDLEEYNENTYFEPYATSLRMSDLGYTNSTQARLKISLNSVDEYINDLNTAICTPEPDYEKIGVRLNGEYRQLSANQLQIENEFYSPVRPKRVAMSGERPTSALRRGGVEYVEIRSLDLNVFDPVGINQNAMRFIEAFLIYCLLEDSPPFDDDEWQMVTSNHGAAAKHGRDPAFRLARPGGEVLLREWASDIVEDVAAVAAALDVDGDSYVQAIDAQRALIDDPEATPSARVLRDMRENGVGFYHFAMAQAERHRDYFQSLEGLEPARLDVYTKEAETSHVRQREIEAADVMTFDDYLAKYFSEQGCCN
jgi:glutamate--cysteine ligase